MQKYRTWALVVLVVLLVLALAVTIYLGFFNDKKAGNKVANNNSQQAAKTEQVNNTVKPDSSATINTSDSNSEGSTGVTQPPSTPSTPPSPSTPDAPESPGTTPEPPVLTPAVPPEEGVTVVPPSSTSSPVIPTTTVNPGQIIAIWKDYNNSTDKYSIKYRLDFSYNENDTLPGVGMVPGTVFTYPSSYTNGTNLNKAAVAVGRTPYSTDVACYRPAGADETAPNLKVINGVNFYSSVITDGNPVTFYETHRYATVKNGYCYNISLFMQSTHIDAYNPATRPAEFDKTAVTNIYKEMLNTFKFLSSSSIVVPLKVISP